MRDALSCECVGESERNGKTLQWQKKEAMWLSQ